MIQNNVFIILLLTIIRNTNAFSLNNNVRLLSNSEPISIIRQSLSKTDVDVEMAAEIPPLCTEPPLKILLLVEPTPFNYISGELNRGGLSIITTVFA